jgi:hypothetical protein
MLSPEACKRRSKKVPSPVELAARCLWQNGSKLRINRFNHINIRDVVMPNTNNQNQTNKPPVDLSSFTKEQQEALRQLIREEILASRTADWGKIVG